MRPISLSLEGLRSFRRPQKVDFTGKDRIAIIGDTGAGKSSLLEAMTWVLYGCTSWSAQPNQELMHASATTLRVVLRFSVRGQTWEVTRILERQKDETVGGAKASLVRYSDDGEAVERVEKAKKVEKRVEELLGLNESAFTRTVILPQGQFARLLVSDKNAQRAAILRQVWRLEGLDAMRVAVREALDALAPVKARVEQALQGEPEDPDGYLKQLESRADETAKAEDSARRAKTQVSASGVALSRSLEEMRTTAGILMDVAGDSSWMDRAEHIAARNEALGREREDFKTQRAEVRRNLGMIPNDDDGLDTASIAEAKHALARIEEDAKKLEGLAKQLRDIGGQKEEVESAVRRKKQHADELRGNIEDRRQKRAELQTAFDEASKTHWDCRAQLDDLRRRNDDLGELRAEGEKHRAKTEGLRTMRVRIADSSKAG